MADALGWTVLQVNANEDEDELCLALLEEGIAVQPGCLGSFQQQGYLIVSLLPKPDVFDAALGRIEVQLHRPTSSSGPRAQQEARSRLTQGPPTHHPGYPRRRGRRITPPSKE